MNSIKNTAMDLFSKGMNPTQALEELTKLGIKAKKGTIATYYATRNKPSTEIKAAQTTSSGGEKKRSAKVTKTAKKIRSAATTKRADNRWTTTDVLDFVYTSDLVAAQKRSLADKILSRNH